MEYSGKKSRTFCLATINDVRYDQRMQRIAKTISSHGHKVTWIARHQFEQQDYSYFRQCPIHCFFNKGFLFYFEFTFRLFYCLLRAPTFDAYYAVDLDTILPMWLLAKWRDSKLIYDAHEYFSETPEVVNRPFVKATWETIAGFAIPRANYRITVGDCLAAKLSHRYNAPFNVIRNVPLQRTIDCASPKKYKLWYQGALNEGRGLAQIIQALHYLPADFYLEIAGDGPLRSDLHDLVKKEGLSQRVHFLGLIVPEQLQKYAVDAFLGLNLLENKGLSYYYSLANKTFDMIQMGLPALHMSFPEYRNINKPLPIGWLVDDLAPEHLAAKISHIAEDAAIWESVRANCFELAKTLHWENEEKKLEVFL